MTEPDTPSVARIRSTGGDQLADLCALADDYLANGPRLQAAVQTAVRNGLAEVLRDLRTDPPTPHTTRPKLLRAIDVGYVIARDRRGVRAWLCPPLRPAVEVTPHITEMMATGHTELRLAGTPLLPDQWVLTDPGRAELDAAIARSMDFTAAPGPVDPLPAGQPVSFRLGDGDHADLHPQRHDEILAGAVLDTYDAFVVVDVPGWRFAHILPAAAVTPVAAAVPAPPGH